jgi:hypothetical protein
VPFRVTASVTVDDGVIRHTLLKIEVIIGALGAVEFNFSCAPLWS